MEYTKIDNENLETTEKAIITKKELLKIKVDIESFIQDGETRLKVVNEMIDALK